MTKKQIIRCIGFLTALCMVVIILCDLFELPNNSNYDKRFYTYRNFPQETIDGVFIGTSSADRYWMAAKAYEEYGMTVFPLSSDAMPTWLFINVIEEAYKYQNPKLILIDLRAYAQENDKASKMDARARRIIDAMDIFSINRVKTAFKTIESIRFMHKDKSLIDVVSYLVPVFKYHSKWSEDDYRFEKNIGSKTQNYAGFFVNSKLSVQKAPQTPVVYNPNATAEFDPLAEASLYELIDYIKEKDLNVLFVDTPQFKSEYEMGIANRVYEILDENGLEYIQFDAGKGDGSFVIDFDNSKDFYDEGHVNYRGSLKFTKYFAKYLDEKYDFPDRREDHEVNQYWDGKYEAILKKMAQYEKR